MNLYNKNFYLNSNNLSKYYKNDILEFKLYLGCFSLFKNRIVESTNLNFNNFTAIDVGFKYIVKADNKSYQTQYTLLKLIKLETFFNDSLINSLIAKNNISQNSNWSIIKKAFTIKSILPGKILNPFRKGFSVGIFGFVGFIPRKYLLTNSSNLKSVFIVNSINIQKKTFVLSQKKINKNIFRILFKLSSQISYVSKN